MKDQRKRRFVSKRGKGEVRVLLYSLTFVFLPWPSMVACMAGAKKAGKGSGSKQRNGKGNPQSPLSFLTLISPPLSTPVPQASLSVAVNVEYQEVF